MGADHDALAVEGPAEDDVAVVAGEGAVDLDDLGAAVLDEAPDAVGVVVLAMDDAAVTGQLFQYARGAVAFEKTASSRQMGATCE